MYYTKFRIQNFKGIKDTTIKLSDQSKMGVFAFVGLNESGKTTLLEAIHSFSPDKATSELVGGDDKTGVPFKKRVPRHLISNFTGYTSVSATVKLEEGEKEKIIARLKRTKAALIINPDTFPDEITLERNQKFDNGDFKRSFFSVKADIKVKTGRQKNWRDPSAIESLTIANTIFQYTPDIAYFPTFVFDFPKKIFLTEDRGDNISKFYRGVFQDILDYDGQGHTIEKAIISRIRSEDKVVPWLNFLSLWGASDDKEKIQHVMDRASSVVTDVVFGRWNEIFGEDAKGKEINISFETLEGEKRDEDNNVIKTDEHDVFIKFQIRDGTRRFEVNDRSLGFRWFFAFMLFTQFRVARESTRPVLFLFDEPASNLHAAAQQKLIESFPEIARDNHTLAYTTHSHYMIEPKWLEQTFIVTNRADTPNDSVLDTLSLEDESLDIKATRYRSFVNDHPSQTSYFQPILDRLRVAPSRFDIEHSSILVEGKSDYYVLRYGARLLERSDLPLVPGMGAGNFASLICLHIGWNLKMFFLLDGDKKGSDEKQKYMQEYGLSEESIATISDLVPSTKVIEDLLDDVALRKISKALEIEKKPTKNQIRRFFQEALAKDEIIDLSAAFKKKITALLDELHTRSQ